MLNDRLLINEPHLMPATNELVIRGIKYRGLSIDLIVRDYDPVERYSLRVRGCIGPRDIMIVINDTEINAGCRAESNWCKYRRDQSRGIVDGVSISFISLVGRLEIQFGDE